MNIEQERKDFEAWYEKEFPYEPIPIRAAEGYFHRYDNKLWKAWQARAALQESLDKSQDREDAERYRRLRDGQIDDIAVVRGLGATDYGASVVIGTYEEEIDGDDLDEAIDLARRIEEKTE